MKKLFIAMLAFLAVGQTYAQQREIRLPERPNRPSYTDHTDKDNGFWCALEGSVGSTIVFNHQNAQRAGLSFIGGYMMNEYLKLGLGLGGNYYFNNAGIREGNIDWTMPIYFDVRGNIISQQSRNLVPFWSIDAGAAVRDGFFFAPTIGLRFGEKRDSWYLGLSYSINEIRNRKDRFEGPVQTQFKYDASTVSVVSLKVGYEF